MTTKPLKIAVAGAHSTGKTTFLRDLEGKLAAQGHSVAYVHDSAADAQALGFPILSGHTFASTSWLMARAIQLEAEASLKAEIILIDRPLHDALGYLLAALEHSSREITGSEMGALETLCAAWADEYDLLLLTRIDPDVPLGPGRDGDLVFRDLAGQHVEQVIRTYFGNRWRWLESSSAELVRAKVAGWARQQEAAGRA